ncbi:MAG: hypothetical protein Q4G27_05880 [Flavobacteriaceae bacterium]|nr:hypothetical protein [Flavobacteriaceae bacterium]
MKRIFLSLAFIGLGSFAWGDEIAKDVNEIVMPVVVESPAKVLDCTVYVHQHTFTKDDGTVVSFCTSRAECDTQKELDEYENSGNDPCWN